MASNPIQNVDNLIANVVNQYIVRPTGGNTTSGINGFVFDIIGDEQMIIDSDITDHFVEDNYAIQDHISLRPVRFSVHGYVAELVDIFPNGLLGILTKIQSLQSIGGYFPVFAAQATQVYASVANVVAKAGEVVNQAKNIYSLITGASTSSSKQQNAYQTFYQMWLSRQLCSVETPWGILNNMAIESMRPLQKENTNLVTDFEIIFKQINVVSTKFIPSLKILNPAGSGQTIPASPILIGNALPNTAPPPSQSKTNINQINTLTSGVSGRMKTMIPPEVPLGSAPGVAPPPMITLPKLLPPVFIPGVI